MPCRPQAQAPTHAGVPTAVAEVVRRYRTGTLEAPGELADLLDADDPYSTAARAVDAEGDLTLYAKLSVEDVLRPAGG